MDFKSGCSNRIRPFVEYGSGLDLFPNTDRDPTKGSLTQFKIKTIWKPTFRTVRNWSWIHPCCMSKKSWPISYSKLLYRIGQDSLDIQNVYRSILICVGMFDMVEVCIKLWPSNAKFLMLYSHFQLEWFAGDREKRKVRSFLYTLFFTSK